MDQKANLYTKHCEYLVVAWAVLLLWPYLEGCRLILRTDRHAVRWILNLADETGMLARCRLRLLEYDFEVVHPAGVKHQEDDALSGLTTTAVHDITLEDEISVMVVTRMKSHHGKKSVAPNRTK